MKVRVARTEAHMGMKKNASNVLVGNPERIKH
jgi:hypothetical protein